MGARMFIKMIIFNHVSILILSHVVVCFPSFEGDSRPINDTNKMLAKLSKSNIKKPKLPNEPVIKFLKKLDCNSDSNFDRDNADTSEILDSCDFDNWEINDKSAKKTPKPSTEITTREISSTTHTFSTYREGGESNSYDEPNTGGQNLRKTESGENSAQATNTGKPLNTTYDDDNGDEEEEPVTGDEKEFENDDNDGMFIRILLMLILVMQNAFVFVLFLFYRSMKKTAKQ